MSRCLLLAAMVGAFAARGASFTGGFAHDDDQAVFTFTLAAPANIVLVTFGYAGGVNEAGNIVGAGGFDPVLTIFSGLGPSAALFNQNIDGGCGLVAGDPVTHACWDAYLSLPLLAAGSYTAVLTQGDNTANGATLGDGFLRDGQGDFTGPTILGTPGSFIDANPSQRGANWAVDIVGIGGTAAVPEPATSALCGAGALAVMIAYQRAKSRRT